jgi:hypothetical protein
MTDDADTVTVGLLGLHSSKESKANTCYLAVQYLSGLLCHLNDLVYDA